jgi:hypothetical protein
MIEKTVTKVTTEISLFLYMEKIPPQSACEVS